MKIITTIPYTSKRADILDSVIGQLSDGIWENSRTMEKYWKSLRYGQTEDGMVWIEDRFGVCAKPLDFFADKIKQIVKKEIEDGRCAAGLEWSRLCGLHPYYFHGDVTVGECYELYELLKGRETTTKEYAQNSEYAVTITFAGNTTTKVVTALSELAAREKAKKLVMSSMTVTAARI